MDNLIQNTLEKIKKEQIAPEPKWKYLLRKYGLWVIFASILVLTALSFSVILDNGRNLDWDLYRYMQRSRFTYALSILPYFWIILAGLFLVVAFLEIRKTETGYRYSQPKILLITLGSLAALGVFLTLFGFGGRINSKLTKDVPFYGRHMMATKESQWMRPGEGFLAGSIKSVSENELKINDLDGKNWDIQINEETLIRPSAFIAPAEMIKIIGLQKNENQFKAEEIRPWEGRGKNGAHGGERKGMMNGSARGGMGTGN